ncbi:hypothetical protein [Paenibacillus sp. MMS20-IR301]|uniref:hypothetical protein n=1 Tax=Paenibacillus sp. MMS20-IR301 TaxID=2895946 RepID=UPI0028EDFA71|nr:hypothetical protein [Paenibacillus sp. MMS20-IR301]WNS41017.1 hypothetical protein LOS79_18390 [Paenibacillus sp. MMS20-IR301]
MKKVMKAILAASLLAGSIVGNVGSVGATEVKPTAAPIMTDNLAKYGLKKGMNLPVTLESEGLKYTLHKIMIYDFKSPEVKKLQQLYGFQNSTSIIDKPKYFIWTKVTLENGTKKKLHGGGNDITITIPFTFKTGQITDALWPEKLASKTNSKEALWTYDLKPGEKITSYLAYAYESEFDYFVIRMLYGKNFIEKYVVSE